MDAAIDSVLQGLNALAHQGEEIDIAILVDGLLIRGTLVSPAAYGAAFAQQLGQDVPGLDAADSSFLHLRDASMPGSSNKQLYRCPIGAVRGFFTDFTWSAEGAP